MGKCFELKSTGYSGKVSRIYGNKFWLIAWKWSYFGIGFEKLPYVFLFFIGPLIFGICWNVHERLYGKGGEQ